jgi:hypothetical protein
VIRILLTGVRGKTGLPLAKSLALRGDVEVLGGRTDPASVSIEEIRRVVVSWDDPRVAGLEGVGDVVELRADGLRGAHNQDRADPGRDHVGVGLGDLGEHRQWS